MTPVTTSAPRGRPSTRRAVTVVVLGAATALVAAVTLTAPPALSQEGVVVIRADTNRDGVVDVTSTSDEAGKSEWTEDSGAIFLPNIGDSEGRGSPSDPENADLSDTELAGIHDANDEVPRATENFAPLRTLPIPDLVDGATGRVELVGPGEDQARLFLQRDGEWVYVDDSTRLTESELTEGVELGLDGRDVMRPGEWDGRVTVRFSVEQDGTTETDEVELRVAPVLTHHHLQEVERIVTAEVEEDPAQRRFIAELAEIAREIGQDEPLVLDGGYDRWAQDFMEPGYATMPGPDGTVRSIRVIIRSPQPEREAGREVFELRGPGTGAIQFDGDWSSLNSMGNLETVPPYTHEGVSHPAGRAITGAADDEEPAFLDFFQEQGVQDPIVLDTSWLMVGHVDEFVQFLPADNDRGWTIAISDPESGVELLRDAQEAGHGSVPIHSRPEDEDDDGWWEEPTHTIDEFLADDDLMDANRTAAEHIDENLGTLLDETGVLPSEVVRVPELYSNWSFDYDEEDRDDGRDTDDRAADDGEEPSIMREEEVRERASDDDTTLVAYVPSAVNGVVVGRDYVAAQQWGPVIDGTDVFADAVADVYAKAGMRVHWIDTWDSHHLLGGEVHCGTNTLRTMNTSWWPTAA